MKGYEYLVMPVGLMNALTIFQSTMNDMCQTVSTKFVLIFFDDILVYSKTCNNNLQHLDIVL